MTSTYEIRGSYYIANSTGYVSAEDADAVVRSQRAGLVSVEWPDGSMGYYLSQEDADRDRTGERAIALVTTSEPS